MTSEAVQVIARIRPEFHPVTDGVVLQQDESTILLLPKPYEGQDAMSSKRARESTAKGFKLDRVFGPSSSNLDVYNIAQPLALSVTFPTALYSRALTSRFISLIKKQYLL